MSLNSGSASGILQGSRYNRGAGTAGTGATHASTVDTGSVLRIETNKTNGIILYCQPETTVPSVNADVQVTLLTAQSTNRGGAFVAPRVGDKIVWLTSKGNSFYLGMSHQATSPHPFLGDTDVDATTGGTNTGGASMLMTGMRIPDQPLGTTSDDPLPIENAQVDGAPGTGFANVPGFDVLMDPKTNTFRSVGEITGNALPNDPYEPYDIPDSVFEKSSSGFKTVMQALNKVKDPAYAKAKGPGFNEISIRSRTAKVADPSGGNPTTNATEPESAPGSAAASGSFDTIGGQGGLTLVGQDSITLTSTGDSSTSTLNNQGGYVGNTYTLEAGTEIILKVGDSSITINQDGIAIAQRELSVMGSSFKMSNDSIEMFSVSQEVNAYDYAVSVPWATLNLGPMNAVIAACQGVEIKSGATNYAPFAENLLEVSLQLASLTAALGDCSDSEEAEAIKWDMLDVGVMATAGCPLNFSLLPTSKDDPLSISPGFAAIDLIGPVLGMVGAVVSEVKACVAGEGGSATVKLNNADVTIQAGYVEQMSNGEVAVAAATATATLAAAATAAELETTGTTTGTQEEKQKEKNKVADVSSGVAVALVLATAFGAHLSRSKKKALLLAGDGKIRIQASESLTSGAYRSSTETLEAADGLKKYDRVMSFLGGSAFPLSVAKLFTIAVNTKFMIGLDKKSFVGVHGVGFANAFTYHSLAIQNSTVNKAAVAVAAEQADTVDAMTNVLLKGPAAKVVANVEVGPAPLEPAEDVPLW